MLGMLATTMATGCATPGPERTLASQGPRMIELYRGGAGDGDQEAREMGQRGVLRCRTVWNPLQRRRVERCRRSRLPAEPPVPAVNPPYTRTAANELELLFPRVPNPDIYIYVYPHLASAERVPVPGYTTAVPLYERVEYALPGEFPGLGDASWPAGSPERVRAGEFPVGPTRPLAPAPGDPETEGSHPRGEPADGPAGSVDDAGEAGADLPGQVGVDRPGGGEEAGGDLDAGVVGNEAEGREQAVEAVPEAETAPVPAPPAEEPAPVAVAKDVKSAGPKAPAGYEVLVNGVRDPECEEVDVRRGSLRGNARRLLVQCGFRLGAWPGDADSVADWVISDGFKARVDGLDGLLELIGGYGLDWTVSERDRRVDFRRRER